MSISIRLTVTIPNDTFTVELDPRWLMRDNPADVASHELDRSVLDAKAWLKARGADLPGDSPRIAEDPVIPLDHFGPYGVQYDRETGQLLLDRHGDGCIESYPPNTPVSLGVLVKDADSHRAAREAGQS